MSIEAIGAAPAAAVLNAGPGAAAAAPANIAPAGIAPAAADAGNAFEAVLDGIWTINGEIQQTQKVVEGMALGETDNLHQVMMSLEHTRLQFEFLMQVRNRVLEAYQELMRMQV